MAGYDGNGIRRTFGEYRDGYCHNVWWWYLPRGFKTLGRIAHRIMFHVKQLKRGRR